jgi:hypothetical protein
VAVARRERGQEPWAFWVLGEIASEFASRGPDALIAHYAQALGDRSGIWHALPKRDADTSAPP